MRTLLAIAVIAVLTGGCGSERAPDAIALVTDSAGIRITSNPAPGEDTEQRRLSATPLVVIGDEHEHPLNQVGNALALSDGRIVLANGGNELLYFTSDGEFVARAGGPGSGPGEFRRLTQLWRLPGDTVAALEGFPPRISYFDIEAIWVRDLPLELNSEPWRPPRLADGSIVFNMGGSGLSLLPPGDSRPALVETTTWIVRHSPGESGVDSIAHLPGSLSYGTARSFDFVPFSPQTFYDAAGDRIYAGWSGRYEIGVYTPDGTLERLIRGGTPPRPITPRVLEQRQGDPGPSDMPIPETAPAFGRLLSAPGDQLWVELYLLPGDTEREWHVYGPDDRLEAVLRVPAEFRITSILPDRLIGVWADELGIQTVRIFEYGQPT